MMRTMKRDILAHLAYWLCILLSIGVCLHARSQQEQTPPRISVDNARRLVDEVVKVHNPGATVSATQGNLDPEFYVFGATWPNPTGSPMIGYFAVNPWTGDVWDFNACKHLESRSLKKLQDGIRKKSGIGRSMYLKLRTKSPLCIGSNDR